MQTLQVKRPAKKIVAKLQSLKDKKGMIAVIEPATGDYILGRNMTEALKKAKSKYPGKVFYSIRIGSSFVCEHKGGLRKQ